MSEILKIGEAPQTDLGTLSNTAPAIDNAPEWVRELAIAQQEPWFWAIVTLLIVWSVAWKGIALWKAGRHDQLLWFIALLLVNTAGLLEILYLLFWQGRKKTK